MTPATFLFGEYRLDGANRQLRRDGEPVEVSSRYLDALILLVSEGGALVSKDRFMAEVWRGVPVTDEALTQCIRALRRALGDEAGRPRFIETVPKHGYRFIAPVSAEADAPERIVEPARPRRAWLPVAVGGTAGGLLAGIVGGLFYGFAAATDAGSGGASLLMILLLLTSMIAVVGGAAVSFGIAAGEARGRAGGLLGGAAGGFLVGAIVKILGTDAFSLLLGRSPGDFTGAGEGLALGAAAGLGAWMARRLGDPRRAVGLATLLGAAGGALIAQVGGTMLGGSLHLLAAAFPQSRLRLDGIGALVGEAGFGPVAHVLTAGLEGALFCGCVVGGIVMARRRRAATA